MADATDLAGVIGTWVAVFLALVALLGLLPAYLLYKRSRSDQIRALSLVDDPNHKFVSAGRKFGYRHPVWYSVKAPDLRSPPTVAHLEKAALGNRPNEPNMFSRKSTTSWIEYAQIITAVFPEVELGGAKILHFEPGNTYLLVHRFWVVALGILHRVTSRIDHGLPVDTAVQIGAGSHRVQRRTAGLSGYLDVRYHQDDGSAYRNPRISFDMHSLEDLLKSLNSDQLSLKDLISLFKGFIRFEEGSLLRSSISRLDISHGIESSRQREVISPRDTILFVDESSDRERDIEIFNNLKLKTKKLFTFRLEDTEPDRVSGSGYTRLGMWSDSEYISMTWKDAYHVAHMYLAITPSAQGFLYNSSEDIIVSKLLQTESAGQILEITRSHMSIADPELPGREEISQGLGGITEPSISSPGWSRHAMQAIKKLDTTIVGTSLDKSVGYKAIRAMYACDTTFRKSMREFLGPNPAGEPRRQHKITVGIAEGIVSIRKQPSNQDEPFKFDFQSILGQTEPAGTNNARLEISPGLAAIACLQAQLRITAWKMALDPEPLRNLENSLADPVLFVCANKFDNNQ